MNPEIYGSTLSDIPTGVTVVPVIYRASWMQPEPTRGGAAASPVSVWDGTAWVALPGPPA